MEDVDWKTLICFFIPGSGIRWIGSTMAVLRPSPVSFESSVSRPTNSFWGFLHKSPVSLPVHLFFSVSYFRQVPLDFVSVCVLFFIIESHVYFADL